MTVARAVPQKELELPQPLPFLAGPAARPLAMRVVAAFAAAGIELRFVGGCIRDCLLGLYTPCTDLDLATPLPPDAVTRLLEGAGLAVKPTGIAYGTVTVVDGPDGNTADKLEITTLRRDLETDGRHATVAFGTDWREDALRRDFTINALSASPNSDCSGTLYDYTDGRRDLAEGVIRFIGDPVARIREDYLRILRFFRFHARFAQGEADAEALGAIAALKAGLADLSAERVWHELGKLLAMPQPQRGIAPMEQAGVLDTLFRGCGAAPDLSRLEAFAEAEAYHDFQVVPVLRLAALFPDTDANASSNASSNTSPGDHGKLAARLKLGRREAAWLEIAADTLAAPTPQLLAQVWYWHQDAIRRVPLATDNWLLSLVFLYKVVWPAADLDAMISFAAGWEPPVLPLAGNDLIGLGIESGPRIGEILAAVEAWWVEENFRPGHADCIARAATLLGQG